MAFDAPGQQHSGPKGPLEQRVAQLNDEVLQLKRAVRSHETVDQAIGVVLTIGRLTPAEAWDVLREVSMHTNTKLRHVAELLVAWGRTGQLRPDICSALKRSISTTHSPS